MLFYRQVAFFKSSFSKSAFKNTIRVSDSLDPDADGLVWVQTVFKSVQQMTDKDNMEIKS